MIFKRVPIVKKKRYVVKDFTNCVKAQNLILSKDCARGFSFNGLTAINSDEYAILTVDGETITIKKSGEVFVNNGKKLGTFDVNNIFCTPVFIGGKEYLYVSDGQTSAFLSPSGISIVAPSLSTVAVFHKGRFYFYENGIFNSSVPLTPEVVDVNLSVDFLTYDNYGKAFYAVDFCGYVYVVSEGGIFKFTEVSDRRIRVEKIIKFSVKIKEGSAVVIGGYLYFLTDDGVYKLKGNTVELVDEPALKGYSLDGVIAGGNSENYYIKNAFNEVVAYVGGRNFFTHVLGVEVNRCGVFKLKNIITPNIYEVMERLPGDFLALKKIKCTVKTRGELTVSTKGNTKTYSLAPGKNVLKIGIYGDEIIVKITSESSEQIIYSLECEY